MIKAKKVELTFYVNQLIFSSEDKTLETLL